MASSFHQSYQYLIDFWTKKRVLFKDLEFSLESYIVWSLARLEIITKSQIIICQVFGPETCLYACLCLQLCAYLYIITFIFYVLQCFALKCISNSYIMFCWAAVHSNKDEMLWFWQFLCSTWYLLYTYN